MQSDPARLAPSKRVEKLLLVLVAEVDNKIPIDVTVVMPVVERGADTTFAL